MTKFDSFDNTELNNLVSSSPIFNYNVIELESLLNQILLILKSFNLKLANKNKLDFESVNQGFNTFFIEISNSWKSIITDLSADDLSIKINNLSEAFDKSVQSIEGFINSLVSEPKTEIEEEASDEQLKQSALNLSISFDSTSFSSNELQVSLMSSKEQLDIFNSTLSIATYNSPL